MAIKISGTTVINDDSNIINVGVVTVGTGGTDGIVQVGTGTTIHGSGDVAIAGTVYAKDLVIGTKILGFAPGNTQEGVRQDTTITITFNNPVSIGTTGYVRLQGGTGIIIDEFGASSQNVAFQGTQVVITPTEEFAKGTPGFANTITTVIDASYIDDPAFTGINTTGSDVTYYFEIDTAALGDPVSGGYLISATGGTQWIVAPYSTEVSRNWYCRNDAVTVANAAVACGDWFIPGCWDMKAPAFTCRAYWDQYSNADYWTTTTYNPSQSFKVSMSGGGGSSTYWNGVHCIRTFRRVFY